MYGLRELFRYTTCDGSIPIIIERIVKMKKKLILSLMILILIFSTGSVGCDIRAGDGGISGNNVAIGSAPVFANLPIPVKPEELFLDLRDILYIIAPFKNGVYVYATTENEPEKWQFHFCNLDDGSITVSEFSLPVDFQLSEFHAMSDGTLIVGGYPSLYDATFQILHLTKEHTIILVQGTQDLSLIGLRALAIDKQGERIYASTGNMDAYSIYVYTITGESLFEVESDLLVRDIVFSEKDHQLYVIKNSGTDLSISIIAEETKTLQETAHLPDGAAGAMIHQSSTHSFCAEHWSKVIGFDSDTNKFTDIFDLTRHGITGWVSSILQYEEFYIVFVDDIADGKQRVLRLTLTEEYDRPVEILRLGKFEKGRDLFVEAAIAEFNFYNPQYLVEIADYSVYGDEAAKRLHLDIIAGEAPDIFLMSEPLFQSNYLPVYQYIANGMLVNLAPYMERDLDFDDFFSSAMKSLYIDDSCYIAVPSFSLYAVIGTNEGVSGLNNINVIDFFKYLRSDFEGNTPQFAIDLTQNEFVIDLILANIKQFVDYNTGDASFDSKEFIALLEAAEVLTPVDEWAVVRLARGLQQCAFLHLDGFADMDAYATALHGDFKISGFPGNPPGVALIPMHIFGVSAATKKVEGAWAFLRYTYQNENLHKLGSVYFPMNRASFFGTAKDYEDYIAETIVEGGGTYHFHDTDSAASVPPIDALQAAVVLSHTQSMVEQIDRIYLVDQDLMNIVNEELTAFFHGSRSAGDTASVVQKRAQIYLWEFQR